MPVLRRLRSVLSRGRSATRSILSLKPVRDLRFRHFKATSHEDASVTTLNPTLPDSHTLVVSSGALDDTQYTAEGTIQSVLDTVEEDLLAPPTPAPTPAATVGSATVPATPLLRTTSLPPSPPSNVTIPTVPDAVHESVRTPSPTSQASSARTTECVPSTPSFSLPSLAPLAEDLPIPFVQSPQAPLSPSARDIVQAYLATAHDPPPSLDLPALVSAVLKLTPSDLVGMHTQQPSGDTYTITRCLGCGAHGWIMEARTGDGQIVAVKIINKARVYRDAPGLKAQFMREILLMAQIARHIRAGEIPSTTPGLASALASWTDYCFDYTVMELYPTDLWRWLQVCHEDEFPFILAAAEMLAGLNRLHRMGYVHCDIKQENFLVSRTGHVVLADFGLAQFKDQMHLTACEMGTSGYIAPEMLFPGLFGEGPAVVNERVDVWGLGLVFLEMYYGAGRGVYDSKGDEGAKLQVATRDPLEMKEMRAIRSHNPVLYDLLSKMLVRDPRYRWNTEDLMRHEFFKGVPWNNLDQWAKDNNFITVAPPYQPSDVTPSHIRNMQGNTPDTPAVVCHQIVEQMLAEPPGMLWFQASPYVQEYTLAETSRF
ncbi:hypothetical protein EIP86_006863 [Pleurotus ostreatoroseus]|nr:hypothetical protein EIP86_006863 [Pleurotus ostreatoroseus]